MSNKRVVATATRVAKKVAGSKEHKFYDTASQSFAFDTTGTIIDEAVVPQGVTVNQRVGKEINMKAVQLRGTIKAGTNSASHAALLLVYDRECNGAALPTISSILTAASSNAFSNRDNAPRFQIVRRWDWVLNGTAGSSTLSTDTSTVFINEYVSLKEKSIKWTSANTDGATTGKIKGNLLLVSVGDTAAGASAPSGTISARLDFSDN